MIMYVTLWQKLFDDYNEIGEMMYSCICRHRGICGTGLNSADFLSGVRNIVDLGGESNPIDFYYHVFSDGQSLTQTGKSL